MAVENFEIIIGIAILALLAYFWETLLGAALAILDFFLSTLQGGLHLFLFWAVTLALALTLVWYFINRHRIRRLSIVDLLPPDEYERKKQEWTQEAMERLVKNPRYHEVKSMLEQQDTNTRMDILSPESDNDLQ